MGDRRKLYVGNIGRGTKKKELENLFSTFGEIERIEMKRKCSFVTFFNHKKARRACEELHNARYLNSERRIVVEFARKKREKGGTASENNNNNNNNSRRRKGRQTKHVRNKTVRSRRKIYGKRVVSVEEEEEYDYGDEYDDYDYESENLHEKDEIIRERDQHINILQTSIRDKEDQIRHVLSEKERKSLESEHLLREKNNQIELLENSLSKKEDEVQNLLEEINQMNSKFMKKKYNKCSNKCKIEKRDLLERNSQLRKGINKLFDHIPMEFFPGLEGSEDDDDDDEEEEEEEEEETRVLEKRRRRRNNSKLEPSRKKRKI